MKLVAYSGPETGQRDRASYVLQQGKVRFVLTTALRADSEIARHVARHGDGVRAIALWVDDAARCMAPDNPARSPLRSGTHRILRRTRQRRHRQHRRLRRHTSHLHRAPQLLRRLPPRLSRYARGHRRPPRRSPARRPHRRQRRLERHERVGRLLLPRHGLLPLPALRRQRHLHRILRPHVEGHGQRPLAT